MKMAEDGSASASPTGSGSASPSPPGSPSLPYYPQLIKTAIAATGGTSGSTKPLISSHISSSLSLSSSLPSNHSTLLSSNLAIMSATGELSLSPEGIYSLPPPPLKRGRGRPPKPRLPGEPGPRRGKDGPRRPRGRPPKPRDPSAPEKAPRPRGRPPKSPNGESGEGAEKRPRGRPPKIRPQFAEVGFV